MVFARRTSQIVVMTALAVVASCGLLLAQDGPSLARMREKLRVGDRVTVDAGSGLTLKGRFLGLTNDTLSISTTAGQQEVGMSDVTRVRRHRRGILVGTLVGTAVGLACGAAMSTWFENEGSDGTGVFLGLTALGAAAGAGIDAALNIPRTVYRRAPVRAGLKISAGPRRTAVGLAVAF